MNNEERIIRLPKSNFTIVKPENPIVKDGKNARIPNAIVHKPEIDARIVNINFFVSKTSGIIYKKQADTIIIIHKTNEEILA